MHREPSIMTKDTAIEYEENQHTRELSAIHALVACISDEQDPFADKRILFESILHH